MRYDENAVGVATLKHQQWRENAVGVATLKHQQWQQVHSDYI